MQSKNTITNKRKNEKRKRSSLTGEKRKTYLLKLTERWRWTLATVQSNVKETEANEPMKSY